MAYAVLVIGKWGTLEKQGLGGGQILENAKSKEPDLTKSNRTRERRGGHFLCHCFGVRFLARPLNHLKVGEIWLTHGWKSKC